MGIAIAWCFRYTSVSGSFLKTLVGYGEVSELTVLLITMGDQVTWVADQLHELVGMSDRSIAEFIIGLCEKSKNPADFIDRIKETGTIDVDDKVSVFASELFNRIPRELSLGERRRIENRKREEQAILEQKKNKGF